MGWYEFWNFLDNWVEKNEILFSGIYLLAVMFITGSFLYLKFVGGGGG